MQAALGAEIEVPTLEGKVVLRISEGTQSGKVLRLRGKGLPSVGGSVRGDQLVRLFVEVPSHLTKGQRELLEKFASRDQHGGVARDEGLPRQAPGSVRLRSRRLRGAAVALLLVWPACAGGPGGVSSRGEDQREWSEAMRLASADPKLGAEALAAFVREHPKSKLADDAGLRLAELTAAKGDTATAARQLEWVVSNHPNGDQSDRARLALAKLERARGEPARARATARKIRIPKLAPPERREAQRLLAELAAEANDPADQLRWLGDLAERPRPGREHRRRADRRRRVGARPRDARRGGLGARAAPGRGAACASPSPSARWRAGDRDAAERALARGAPPAAGAPPTPRPWCASRRASRRSRAPPRSRCSRARIRGRARRATPSSRPRRST